MAAATTGTNVGFFSSRSRLLNLSLGLRCEKASHRTVRSGGKSMRGTFFRKLLRDTRGATAVEYGLIVALVVIAIMVSMQSVANENTGLWAIVTRNVVANM